MAGESYDILVFNINLHLKQTLTLPFIPHRLKLSKDKTRLFMGGGKYSSSAKSYNMLRYTSPY